MPTRQLLFSLEKQYCWGCYDVSSIFRSLTFTRLVSSVAAFGATKKRHFNKSIIHLNGSISKTIAALFYGTAKRHLGDAAKNKKLFANTKEEGDIERMIKKSVLLLVLLLRNDQGWPIYSWVLNIFFLNCSRACRWAWCIFEVMKQVSSCPTLTANLRSHRLDLMTMHAVRKSVK